MATAPEITGLDYVGRQSYLAWAAEVAARGGMVVRLGDQAGKLRRLVGERYPAAVIAAKKLSAPMYWSTGKAYGYYSAPWKVLALDKLNSVEESVVIAEGKVAAVAEDLSKSLMTKILTGIVVGVVVLLVVQFVVAKLAKGATT